MIRLDSNLLNDGVLLGKFELCHVLLMRDANYPWCVLIPDRENITEIFELTKNDQNQLNIESNNLLKYLKNEFNADKMNVAALGNVVSQLHVHHIVRYKKDICWPKPIWGIFPAKDYTTEELNNLTRRLCLGFSTLDLNFKIK